MNNRETNRREADKMPATIEYKKGSIFNTTAKIIVIPVNCVGAMGKGLALQIREKFPHVYTDYKRRCNQADGSLMQLSMDNPQLYIVQDSQWFVYFPTKFHWKEKTSFEQLEKTMELFVKKVGSFGYGIAFPSIAFPALGCGEGGLDWKIVKPMMEKYLKTLDRCRIEIYEPGESRPQSTVKQRPTIPA